MTKNQIEFLKVFDYYQSDYVDNLNVMDATEWTKRKIICIGRGLQEKGLVSYVSMDEPGTEGGMWERLKNRYDKTA